MLPVTRQQLSRFCIIAENFALSALREATSVSNCTFALQEIRYCFEFNKNKKYTLKIYDAVNNYMYEIYNYLDVKNTLYKYTVIFLFLT